MFGKAIIERRKAVLRAKGVPEKFVEPLATRKIGVLREAGGMLMATVVLLGFAVWQASSANRVMAVVHGWFYGAIQPGLLFTPTFFFDMFCLLGMNGAALTALLAGAAVWGTFFPDRARPWPAYSPTASLLRALGRYKTLKTTKPVASYQRLAYLSSDVAFLEAVIRDRPNLLVKGAVRMAAIFAGIFGVLGFLASQDYVRITESRIEIHHAWGSRVYQFRDVKRAESQCVEFGKSAGYHYTLVLPGTRLELFPVHSMEWADNRPGALQRLARLDGMLAALKVQDLAVGQKGQTRDQYNGCLTAWRTRAGVNDVPFPRLVRPL